MKPPSPAFRVLVIDDTPSIHDDFRKILTPPAASAKIAGLASAIFGKSSASPAPSYKLDSALQGQEGFALVQQAIAAGQPYALAFVDMRIPPGWDGLETIARIRTVDTSVQIVICTAYSDHSWSAITERIGSSDNVLILKKPFDHVEVLQLAHALCQKWQLARDNVATLRSLDELVQRRTAQLAEAEERFSQAFSASPIAQAIVSWDPASIIDVNPAFEKQFDIVRSKLSTYRPDVMLPPPLSWARFVETLTKGEPIDDRPFTRTDAKGKERHLRVSVRAVTISDRACAIVVVRDVTEQVEAEHQLRQSQKLEAIGQLSAGIAHDFNNLLTVIHGYTSELLAGHPDAETRQMLEPVQTAATRAASLVRQLLIFSRKEVIQPQMIDLGSTLGGLRPLLRRLIESSVELEWSLADNLPLVFADAANMEQILVNLVVNARDAMPQGGRITVKALRCTVDAATAALEPGAKHGDYIALSVADTGTGIPPDVLSHIFEPFFTTKEVGKGTGLGLSTVYSIAKQHGGWIHVDTAVGRGTTFTLYHPVPEATVAGAANGTRAPLARRSHSHHARARNILVAEDDATVQEMFSAVLNRRHMKFSVAPDGASALSLWVNAPLPYDLLIADMLMPNGFSGVHLAKTFREQNSRLPVILTSGDTQNLESADLRLPGAAPIILPKPFTPDQLIAAISDAMSQPG